MGGGQDAGEALLGDGGEVEVVRQASDEFRVLGGDGEVHGAVAAFLDDVGRHEVLEVDADVGERASETVDERGQECRRQ